MAIKKSKEKVPVVHFQTGEEIGQASENDIVPASMDNYLPYLNLNGVIVAVAYMGSKIEAYPGRTLNP